MRTTLDLDETLLARAEQRATEMGTTLTALIEEALRAALGTRPPSPARYELRWATHHGRVLPGVILSARDSLYEAMEGRR